MVCEKFRYEGFIYDKHHFSYCNNFALKNQNPFCKLKFGTSTYPDMWSSIRPEILFLDKFVVKIKIVCLT